MNECNRSGLADGATIGAMLQSINLIFESEKTMQLWKYPTKIWQYPLFAIGFVLFYLMIPVWFILSRFWWKEDSAFILVHWEAIFMNPWVLFHVWKDR